MQSYGRQSIRVYLVDDHDIVRRGLRDLMSVKRDISVVGDSSSAEKAVDRIISLRPDVMVLDLQLQDGSGIHVCRAVRSVAPEIRGLLVTSASDDEALVSTLLAGASGYATKLVNGAVILDDVRKVGSGRDLVEPGLAATAGRRLIADAESGSLGVADEDVAVLRLMLDGETDSGIATLQARSVHDVSAAVRRVVDAVTRRLAPS